MIRICKIIFIFNITEGSDVPFEKRVKIVVWILLSVLIAAAAFGIFIGFYYLSLKNLDTEGSPFPSTYSMDDSGDFIREIDAVRARYLSDTPFRTASLSSISATTAPAPTPISRPTAPQSTTPLPRLRRQAEALCRWTEASIPSPTFAC